MKLRSIGLYGSPEADTTVGSEDGGESTSATGDEPYAWNLPPGFPEPDVPDDNPMTAEKVELGRHPFYERRLSGNQTQSCGSCHERARAFADGQRVPTGSTGQALVRDSMSLTNAGDGAANPHKSGFVSGFTLTDGEREDLLAFLESLTDETFLSDPRFADPFER